MKDIKLGYTLCYVDDVAQTMAFYEKAFGLKPGFRDWNGFLVEICSPMG